MRLGKYDGLLPGKESTKPKKDEAEDALEGPIRSLWWFHLRPENVKQELGGGRPTRGHLT